MPLTKTKRFLSLFLLLRLLFLKRWLRLLRGLITSNAIRVLMMNDGMQLSWRKLVNGNYLWSLMYYKLLNLQLIRLLLLCRLKRLMRINLALRGGSKGEVVLIALVLRETSLTIVVKRLLFHVLLLFILLELLVSKFRKRCLCLN